MTKQTEKPISASAILRNARWTMTPHAYPTAYLDPRADLARKLLEVSMIAPKYNGAEKPAELVDTDTLVTRAFDAAELFYQEAAARDCLISTPPVEEIEAANNQARAEDEGRKRSEENERRQAFRDAELEREQRHAARKSKAA